MGRLTIPLVLAMCALPAVAQAQAGAGIAGQNSSPQNGPGQSTPSQTAPVNLDHPRGQAASKPQTASANVAGDFSFDNFNQFSATMSGGIAQSGDFVGHVYRLANLMRMEGNAPKGNYFLTNLETHETHGFASTGCIDFDYPYSRSFPFMLSGSDKKYEITPTGKETVDGHVTRVDDVTISSPNLKQPFLIRIWRAEDLQGFPIKIENRRPGARKWSIHYSDVVLGAPDLSLFIIPSKCENYGLPDKGGNSSTSDKDKDDDSNKKDDPDKTLPPEIKPQ
jgi:hypothetical protein